MNQTPNSDNDGLGLLVRDPLRRVVSSSGVQQLISKNRNIKSPLKRICKQQFIASQQKNKWAPSIHPRGMGYGMGWCHGGLGKLVLRMQQPPAQRCPKTSPFTTNKNMCLLRKQYERVQGTWKKCELHTTLYIGTVNMTGSRWGIP